MMVLVVTRRIGHVASFNRMTGVANLQQEIPSNAGDGRAQIGIEPSTGEFGAQAR